MDKRIRKLRRIHQTLHSKDDIERLYVTIRTIFSGILRYEQVTES